MVTSVPSICSNSFSTRRYVDFVAVPSAGRSTNTVLLELMLKKLTTYSVVPELLVDQKFFQSGLGAELSYAGYEDNQLVEVSHFSADRTPVSLGIVVDTSGSMAGEKWSAAVSSMRVQVRG